MIVGAFRFPLATLGIIEASTTLRLSRPGGKEYLFKINRAKIKDLSLMKNKTALIEKLFSTHCEIMYNMLQYKQVKNSHKIAMNGKCHFHRFSFRHASPTSFENGCCWNKQR